jgi:hypothetical protein
MATRPNLRDRELAVAVAAAFRFLRGRPEDVPSKLATVGVVACAAAVNAAASSPPAGWVAVILTARAWLGTVAGTFFGGLLAIWAGLWVKFDVQRRATAGQVILGGAVALLLVAVNLSDAYDDPVFIFNLVLGAMD